MNNNNTEAPPEIKGPAQVICDYQAGLKIERSTQCSKSKAAGSSSDGARTVLGYKRCTLSEYEKTYDYYRNLDNHEFLDMELSMKVIVDEVKMLVAWDEELGKLIKEEAGKLNELKAKLLEANNAACAMSNCLKGVLSLDQDRCTGKNTPEATGWKKDVNTRLGKVTEKAGHLSKLGQKTAGAMVKTAGIHTFANLHSLDELLKNLPTSIKDLRTATDNNIKAAAEGEKKAQTELVKAIDDLNTAESAGYDADSTYNGLHEMITFICEGTCQPLTEVEEICKETIPKTDDVKKPDDGCNTNYRDGD